MNDENRADLLQWVRNQIVDLCEATEDDPVLRRLAESDTR